MATHSSILAWRIPWTEEPGGSRGSDKTEGLSMHACGLPLPSSKSVFYKLHPGVKRMMKSL